MNARTRVVVAALFVVPVLGLTATTQGAPTGSEAGMSCPPGTVLVEGGDLAVCIKDETRKIAGRVMLACKGKSSCSPLPVKGVAIQTKRAGKRGGWKGGARTDEEGRYSFKRKKGVYRVRARKGRLRVKPRAKKADLRKTGTRTANFQACGFKLGSRASAARLAGGLWVGGNRDCKNVVHVSWAPAGGVSVTWQSIGVCTGRVSGKDELTDPVMMFDKVKVSPGTPGHELTVGADSVSFKLPRGDWTKGYGVRGEINDRAGSVHARFYNSATLCDYGINGLPLTRKN